MRVAPFGLVLLLTYGFFGIAVSQDASVSSNTSANSEKTKWARDHLAEAQSLHSALVSALSNGQRPTDRLPNEILQSYSPVLTSHSGATMGRGGVGRDVVISYQKAIVRTEDVMRDSGLRVKVAIQASPGKCNIKYRPVIGGAELDAGQTDLSADVDPRWYVFSCDCKAPPIEQRVDCTQDKKIAFACK
jgi:hypothetical protein